jgi:hypothetical protein
MPATRFSISSWALESPAGSKERERAVSGRRQGSGGRGYVSVRA